MLIRHETKSGSDILLILITFFLLPVGCVLARFLFCNNLTCLLTLFMTMLMVTNRTVHKLERKL